MLRIVVSSKKNADGISLDVVEVDDGFRVRLLQDGVADAGSNTNKKFQTFEKAKKHFDIWRGLRGIP